MRWTGYIFLLLLMIPVQTTLADQLAIQGIKPDLVLIAVYLVGFRKGELDGLIIGALMGIFMDLFSGGLFGTNLLTKPIVGWVGGLVGRTVLDVRIHLSMGALLGVSLLTGLMIAIYLAIVRGGLDFLAALRWIILPQALYDAALGGVLLSLLSLRGKVRRRAFGI